MSSPLQQQQPQPAHFLGPTTKMHEPGLSFKKLRQQREIAARDMEIISYVCYSLSELVTTSSSLKIRDPFTTGLEFCHDE